MAPVTEKSVRGILAENPNLDLRDIDVQVEDGCVRLQGRVRTQRESEAAETVVLRHPGVHAVQNNLEITGEPI